MPTPRITIVVVTHDSEDVVGACLRSLPGACAGAAVSTTVVVDSASTDGTIAAVRAAAPEALLYRLDRNRGYAAGINAAAAAVPAGVGDALLVLNPDVRLAPGSVARLLAALELRGVGIAVPRLVAPDGSVLPSLRRDPSITRALGEALVGGRRAGRFHHFGEVVCDPRRYEEPAEVDWATGAALLVSRACLDAVGRWDESFFLYSEEVEFAQRARAAGFTVRYEPAAEAVHLGGRSNDDPKLWSLLVRNRIRLYRRHHGPVRSIAFGAVVVLNEALRAAARPTSRAALRGLATRERPEPSAPGPQRGVVCFSAQDWWYFNRAHSDFQLLTRVARHRPVLLVNSIGMRLPMPGRTTRPVARVVRKLASVARGLRRPLPGVPGFAVLTPVFLPVFGPGRLRALNAGLVRWQVERAARRLGIGDATLVVTLPTAWDVARRMRYRGLVANRSDRYGAFDEADRAWVEGLERELLAAADVATYASTALLEREQDRTARPVLLDHGVDLDRFDPALVAELPEPADLARIPRPRVGFVGAIDDYTVDLALVRDLAVAAPETNVVLVGPSNCALDDLVALPNVHWLGPKPMDEVPRYAGGLDVALMPWLDNEWIRHCHPIKLKEHLALGTPVVTTPFPDVRRYGDLVRVAPASGFVPAVLATLRDGGPAGPARRRAAVASCSWDDRARELLALCDEAAAGGATPLRARAGYRATTLEPAACAAS